MAKKPLGPEGARFKKANWNPQESGEKRTYLEAREALEARNSELEAKITELETALADPALGSLFREVRLPSWVFEEHKGPHTFAGIVEIEEPPVEESVRIVGCVESLMQAHKEIYDETNKGKGLTGEYAVNRANIMKSKIKSICENRVDNFDYGANRFKIKTQSGEIELICESSNPRFVVENGDAVDKSTIIYRYPVNVELYERMRLACYELQHQATELFNAYVERSEKAADMYGRIHSLKMSRRKVAWVGLAGFVAAIGLYIYSDLPIPFTGGPEIDSRLACANTLVGQNGGKIPPEPKLAFLSHGSFSKYDGSDNWFKFDDKLTANDSVEVTSVKLGPDAYDPNGSTLRAQVMNRSDRPIGSFSASLELAKMNDQSCEHGAFQTVSEYSGRVIQPGTSGEVVFAYDKIYHPMDGQSVAIWLTYGPPSPQPSER